MTNYSYIFNAHPSFIESMYEQYTGNPESVDNGWRTFFEGFDFALRNDNGDFDASVVEDLKKSSSPDKEFRVIGLINGYRRRGHLLSTTNPIRERLDREPYLDLEDYDLTEADLDTPFVAGREIGMKTATLREIINRLKKIYCGNIGMEYFYISKKATRRWLRQKLERFNDDSYGFDLKKKKRILEKLNGAVGFEAFLNKKYVGQKRFSLEGGESAIPALDAIIETGAGLGVEEFVIGMAHRGRLNVLANIMGKTYAQIFNEFEGEAIPDLSLGDGDVKYHLGFSSQVDTESGSKVNLKLVPNPSHLEAVNPVVGGYSRAKGNFQYGSDFNKITPILIHGDAAIAGQGVVYETVQMGKLKAYSVGGTIHLVINNQVGFTTDFTDARSSTYCTGVASVVEAPVIHVNGDDPEAVVFAAELAMEYRQKFGTDFFIDMVCYRRHGHNEGDDPNFTQPKLYNLIKKHPDPRKIYSEKLISKGTVEAELVKEMDKAFNDHLQARLDQVREKPLPYSYQETEKAWRALKKKVSQKDFDKSPETGVDLKILKRITKHLMTPPKDFNMLSKINRLLKGTQKKIDANAFDWALGELLAYGSILLENKDVRMTGQDVKRGTFSHRHAVFFDAETKEEYNRLNSIGKKQGQFRIHNSLLSEFAVLGFEFGYTMATPTPLVIWEAQFGDFYNGAQVMVDQFITSSESKWQRMSGLVMLLPHGYAGQGPEHSSARLERFLQQCAEHNMTVANVTTPANFFHILRRQLARPFRKPLVIMSPKSMLRHPECVSAIEEFGKGTRFQEVLDDPVSGKTKTTAKKVKKLVMCTGKFYYDIKAKQQADKRDDIAIVRIEQLYPFPAKQVQAVINKYKGAEIVWAQEEPRNMGAWVYMMSNAYHNEWAIKYVARKSSASPATGFKKVHDKEQAALLDEIFG